MTAADVAGVRQEIQSEIESAVAFAKTSPFPAAAEASRFVYAE